jgi:hypothetical protein
MSCHLYESFRQQMSEFAFSELFYSQNRVAEEGPVDEHLKTASHYINFFIKVYIMNGNRL